MSILQGNSLIASTRSLDLPTIVANHAESTPEKVAFTWVDASGREAASLTYRALHRRAMQIAGQLAGSDRPVLLLHPPGLEFVVGFFGTLYSGRVAVPTSAPDPARLGRSLARLRAVVRSVNCDTLLTDARSTLMRPTTSSVAPELASLRWVSSDASPSGPPGLVSPDDPSQAAYLQFTSGSTRRPRGVVVSHDAALRMVDILDQHQPLSPSHTLVGWVPLHHDLGLVCHMLYPVVAGAHSVLLSPADFVRDPGLWLRMVSRYRALGTSAPNFALELACRRIAPEARAELDLRALRILVCGGEPVRPRTRERFDEAFGPQGLRPDAFACSYGLAESVVALCIAHPPQAMDWCAESLEAGRARPARPGRRVRRLLSAGRPLAGTTLRIVDPQSHAVLPADTIGELWASGPQVTRGYWGDPEDDEATFGAYLDDGTGPWLRTGDLAFVHDEQLFIVGRHKDLLIVDGRKIAAHDIEAVIDQAHPAVRHGGCAVFSVDDGSAERTIAVVEVREPSWARVVAPAIGPAVRRACDLVLDEVLVVSKGAIGRTSSGKIQRHATRQRYSNGRLEVLARDLAPTPGEAAPGRAEHPGSTLAALVERVARGIEASAGARGGRLFHRRATVLAGHLTLSSPPPLDIPLFRVERLGVIVRHSNGHGDDDAAPDVRGATLRLLAPSTASVGASDLGDHIDRASFDLLLTTGECFFASTAAEFARWMMMSPVERVQAASPRRASLCWAQRRTAESYTELHYYAKQTLATPDGDGVRFRLAPGDDGPERGTVTPSAMLPPTVPARDPYDRRPTDYLHRDLRARLAEGPIRYRLQVQDCSELSLERLDSTRAWDRPWTTVGTLHLTARLPESVARDEEFQPDRLPPGLLLLSTSDPEHPASLHQLRTMVYRRAAAIRRTSEPVAPPPRLAVSSPAGSTPPAAATPTLQDVLDELHAIREQLARLHAVVGLGPAPVDAEASALSPGAPSMLTRAPSPPPWPPLAHLALPSGRDARCVAEDDPAPDPPRHDPPDDAAERRETSAPAPETAAARTRSSPGVLPEATAARIDAAQLREWFQQWLGLHLPGAPDAIDLRAFGVDAPMSALLSSRLSQRLGRTIPVAAIEQSPTLGALASLLSAPSPGTSDAESRPSPSRSSSHRAVTHVLPTALLEDVTRLASRRAAAPASTGGPRALHDLLWVARIRSPQGGPRFPEAVDALLEGVVDHDDHLIVPAAMAEETALLSLGLADLLQRYRAHYGTAFDDDIDLLICGALGALEQPAGYPPTARPFGRLYVNGASPRAMILAGEARRVRHSCAERLEPGQRASLEALADVVSSRPSDALLFEAHALAAASAEYLSDDELHVPAVIELALAAPTMPGSSASVAARLAELTEHPTFLRRIDDAMARPRDGLHPGADLQELALILHYLRIGRLGPARAFGSEYAWLRDQCGPRGVPMEVGSPYIDVNATAVVAMLAAEAGAPAPVDPAWFDEAWQPSRQRYAIWRAPSRTLAFVEVSVELNVLGAALRSDDEAAARRVWDRTLALLEDPGRDWSAVVHLSPLHAWERVLTEIAPSLHRFVDRPTRVHLEVVPRVLSLQHVDGGFGSAWAQASNVEETSLALIGLCHALEAELGAQASAVRTAILHGRRWLHEHRDPAPALHNARLTHQPPHVVQAARLAALALAARVVEPSDTQAAIERASAPREIWLTGATGFIGVHLLHELLRAHPDARVTALVRGPSDAAARERLEAHLREFELLDAVDLERVRVAAGDLEAERLGLPRAAWQYAAREADLIVHAAAALDHSAPWPRLAATNVEGTQRIIALARAVRPCALALVSTLDVFPRSARRIYPESQRPHGASTLATGYARSKAEAERRTRTADANGLPTCILRPGLVLGGRAHGRSPDHALVESFIDACLAIRCAPAGLEDIAMDAASVDDVARATVALLRRGDAYGHTFHLVNGRLSLLDIVRRLPESVTRGVPRGRWWRSIATHDHPHARRWTAMFRDPAFRSLIAFSGTSFETSQIEARLPDWRDPAGFDECLDAMLAARERRSTC